MTVCGACAYLNSFTYPSRTNPRALLTRSSRAVLKIGFLLHRRFSVTAPLPVSLSSLSRRNVRHDRFATPFTEFLFGNPTLPSLGHLPPFCHVVCHQNSHVTTLISQLVKMHVGGRAMARKGGESQCDPVAAPAIQSTH